MELILKDIPGYPDNGNHEMVDWDIPIDILKGYDYNYTKSGRKDNKRWYIYLSVGICEPSFTVMFKRPDKGFNRVEDAALYAVNEYKRWLDGRFIKYNSIVFKLKKSR